MFSSANLGNSDHYPFVDLSIWSEVFGFAYHGSMSREQLDDSMVDFV